MFKLLLLPLLLNATFNGDFTQGGLVEGKTSKDATIYQDGKKLKNYDGRFFLGFNRDNSLKTKIKITMPGGISNEKTFDVVKREYDIQRIDDLPSAKVNPPKMDWNRIKKENALIGKVRTRTMDKCPELKFVQPAEGVISGVYGSQRILNGEEKRPHFGIDYAAPEGAPVIAPEGGKVVLTHDDMFYTGGTIAIDHGCGLVSVFSHLSEITVTEGTEVMKGEKVGKVGSTGRSTGPHLDWRVNLGKIRLDPGLLVKN